jgi:hypothetical protein
MPLLTYIAISFAIVVLITFFRSVSGSRQRNSCLFAFIAWLAYAIYEGVYIREWLTTIQGAPIRVDLIIIGIVLTILTRRALWPAPEVAHQSTLSDMMHFTRRWRSSAYSIAIGVPLFATLITAIIILLDPSGATPRHSISSQFLDLPRYVIFAGWPFVILDFLITRRLRDIPNGMTNQSVKRSAIGALTGMTIPYAFVYLLWPSEMSSAHNDAGQGVGILLILLGWIVGPICAYLGWVSGIKERNSPPRHNDPA